MSKYLTKSRFKVALECSRKLAYVGNPEYVNTKQHDEFLRSLAEGGFQVGELAQLLYPGGVLIQDQQQAEQISHTNALLRRDDVIIYEATLQYGDWVARIDVLQKQGNRIDLIEVKSKSFDSRAGDVDTQWRTRSNSRNQSQTPNIKSDILPYLQDVAFQTMIARSLNPDWKVVPFLMVVDKAVKASVDGLNQMFKICKTGAGDRQRSHVVAVPGVTRESVGVPLLKSVDVSGFVDEIINGTVQTPEGEKLFHDAALQWVQAYAQGQTIEPVIGAHCRRCEFVASESDQTHRSGFHECWAKVTHLTAQQINGNRPITRLYHPVKGELAGCFQAGVYWLTQIDESSFELKSSDSGMSRTDRQHLQIFGEWTADKRFEFDAALWQQISERFIYPLHFIDFEGCRPALPFLSGKRPYDQVAFQFSHHVMHEDGSVAHASEFIDVTPGHDRCSACWQEAARKSNTRQDFKSAQGRASPA